MSPSYLATVCSKMCVIDFRFIRYNKISTFQPGSHLLFPRLGLTSTQVLACTQVLFLLNGIGISINKMT